MRKVKDHIFRELIDGLRDVALQHHGSQQLRARIADCLKPYLICEDIPVVAENNLPPLPEADLVADDGTMEAIEAWSREAVRSAQLEAIQAVSGSRISSEMWIALADAQRVVENAAAGRVARMNRLASDDDQRVSNFDASAEPSDADMPPALTASTYRLSEKLVDPDFRIEEVKQRDGSYLWAGRLSGRCLSKSGKMVYEPMPSSRTDEFLEQCRFYSPMAIIEVLLKYREG